MPVVAFSFGGAKRKDTSLNKTLLTNPGPGTYTDRESQRYQRGCSMSIGKRPDAVPPEARKIPGPGSYKQNTTIGSGAKWQFLARTSGNSIYSDNKVPGPGAYKPKDPANVTPKYTMHGKFKQGTNFVLHSDGTHEVVPAELIDKTVPGPGTYTPQHSQVNKSLATKFGNGGGRPGVSKDQRSFPAPNAYARDCKTASMKKAPAFGFGSSPNRPQTQGNEYIPGPGSYKSKDITGNENHGRVILSRYTEPKTSNMLTPGPGTYVARFNGNQSSSPSVKIGNCPRDNLEKAHRRACNFPPPDTYSPKYQSVKERSSAWGFGNGNRPLLASTSLDTPAPGTYKTPKTADGPKYSMYTKLFDTSYIGTAFRYSKGKPGPGTYAPDFAKTVKSNGSFSFRGKLETNYDNKCPGPGAYTAKSGAEVKTIPSFRFGSGPQREQLPRDGPPGPGNYHVPCEIGNMPQYTMARPKEFAYI